MAPAAGIPAPVWRAGIFRAIRIGSRPGPWKRGLVLAALALLLGLFMLLHAKIPNRVGNVGSLVETFLPWFGLFIPVLLAGALWRRSASAVAALLLPVMVWLNLFGWLLSDKSHPGGRRPHRGQPQRRRRQPRPGRRRPQSGRLRGGRAGSAGADPAGPGHVRENAAVSAATGTPPP